MLIHLAPPDHRPQSSPSSLLKPSNITSQQSRTFLSQLKRQARSLKDTTAAPSASPAAENIGPVPSNLPPLQLTNLPYFIRRTPSNQLPVYLVTKAGGTKQQTKIQKTEGDVDALRNDLARALGFESGDPRAKKNPDVTINRLNGHIIVKVRRSWVFGFTRLTVHYELLTDRLNPGLAKTRDSKVSSGP